MWLLISHSFCETLVPDKQAEINTGTFGVFTSFPAPRSRFSAPALPSRVMGVDDREKKNEAVIIVDRIKSNNSLWTVCYFSPLAFPSLPRNAGGRCLLSVSLPPADP